MPGANTLSWIIILCVNALHKACLLHNTSPPKNSLPTSSPNHYQKQPFNISVPNSVSSPDKVCGKVLAKKSIHAAIQDLMKCSSPATIKSSYAAILVVTKTATNQLEPMACSISTISNLNQMKSTTFNLINQRHYLKSMLQTRWTLFPIKGRFSQLRRRFRELAINSSRSHNN